MSCRPARRLEQAEDQDTTTTDGLLEGRPRRALDRLCDWLLAAGAPSTLAGGGPDSIRELQDALERLDGLARRLTADNPGRTTTRRK